MYVQTRAAIQWDHREYRIHLPIILINA